MRVKPDQDDINERKKAWQYIRWWTERLLMTPEELSRRTRFSLEDIKKGLAGEPVPVRHRLVDFTEALGLDDYRMDGWGEPIDSRTYDALMRQLEPPKEPYQYRLLDDWGS